MFCRIAVSGKVFASNLPPPQGGRVHQTEFGYTSLSVTSVDDSITNIFTSLLTCHYLPIC